MHARFQGAEHSDKDEHDAVAYEYIHRDGIANVQQHALVVCRNACKGWDCWLHVCDVIRTSPFAAKAYDDPEALLFDCS